AVLPKSSNNEACILSRVKYTCLRKRLVGSALVRPVSMAARCWFGILTGGRERHEDVEGTERAAVAGIGGGGDLAAGGRRGVCGGSRAAGRVGVGPAGVGVA